MTIASWLLYNRRSLAGRTPDPDPGLDSHLLDRDPNLCAPRCRHGHGHGRRQHSHPEDCDPSRRTLYGSPLARHLCHRVNQTECEATRLDLAGASEFRTGSSFHGTTVDVRVSRLGLVRNDQLPATVVQARERLLQRLRQNNAALSTSEDEPAANVSIISIGEWEPEVPTGLLDYGTIFTDYRDDAEMRKPAGLSLEAFCNLQREVFRDAKQSDIVARVLLECCICLERFQDGDGLIKLRCGHKFHPPCLEPWVRTCGDCPYCRTSVHSLPRRGRVRTSVHSLPRRGRVHDFSSII